MGYFAAKMFNGFAVLFFPGEDDFDGFFQGHINTDKKHGKEHYHNGVNMVYRHRKNAENKRLNGFNPVDCR
ncbi:hypothetical protein SDC9_203944 [bioreactor metagenome]|uniref:Uncharacterized protein n=1 Tax=bioreactor metagenome TaxID=1076179 RepID=A0A645IXW9_9ZZZZ